VSDPLHSLEDVGAGEPILRRRPFRLFLSHTSAHRVLAEEIGDRLGELGVDTFVAHSTITPTDEWQKVIESALRSCDAMAALITPDFKGSEYCDQELGVALARELLVIPVRQGADPHGFLRSQQGLPGDTSSAAGLLLADRLHDTLLDHRKTEGKMAQVLVFRYARSKSYIEALCNLKCLLEIREDHWNPEMVTMVRAAELENPYVKRSNIARDLRAHLEEIFGPSLLRMFN
jgi:hypothetical protein